MMPSQLHAAIIRYIDLVDGATPTEAIDAFSEHPVANVGRALGDLIETGRLKINAGARLTAVYTATTE